MARWCASPRPRRRNERALILDHYDWSGGREAMLRFGPDTGPVVVMALPLFEEANRVRAFAVAICRALAERGVASALPDVSGQGESPIATHEMTLATVRNGFAAVIEQLYREKRRAYSTSFRSGAIVEGDAKSLGRWCFSPVAGQALVAELGKVVAAAGRKIDAERLKHLYQVDDGDFPIEVAGNLVGLAMLQEVSHHRDDPPESRHGIPIRVVRLDTDPKPADRHVTGSPLWRRAEPGNDLALAALLADDIADWIAACEG